MGMFDYVQCDYPLPGKKVEFVKEFQTKCLDCTLDTIVINEDGELVGYPNHTGTIEFYGSNIVACGPVGVFTRDGEDIESVDFLATFVNGQLTKIEQTSYERKPALSTKDMPDYLRGGDRKGSELDENSSLIGQKLYLKWGGRSISDGYYVEVVYESNKKLCVKDEDGNLELVDRFQIGNLIFKDFNEAKEDDDFRKKKLIDQKEEYARKLQEKLALKGN